MSQVAFELGATIAGACVGSFLNVVIHRLPQEDPAARSLGGRSRCPHCNRQIAWYDNLPILGWVLLRGRGRCCKQPISIRYPLVEAITALLFLWLARATPHGSPWPEGQWSSASLEPFLALCCDAAFVAFLVANTFIDLDHRILPDALTKPFMVLGCTVVAWFSPGHAGTISDQISPALDSLLASLLGLGMGLGLTGGIRTAARFVFRKEAMGLGDVKFMGAIGAFTGWDGALLTFFFGCIVGALGGLLHRVITRDAYVPFGPFLAIGAFATLFFRQDVLEFLFVTWPEWQRSSPSATPIMAGSSLLCIFALVFLVRRGRGNG